MEGFGVYGVVALLFTFIGFRGEAPNRGITAMAMVIPTGLELAKATTWYLTPYLCGVSLTDLTTFVVSAGIVAGIVPSASLLMTDELQRIISPRRRLGQILPGRQAFTKRLRAVMEAPVRSPANRKARCLVPGR